MEVSLLLFLFLALFTQGPAQAARLGACFACPAYDASTNPAGLIGDGFATTQSVARKRALEACNSDRVDYPHRRCQLGACEVIQVKAWQTCGDYIADGKGNSCSTYWTGSGWQTDCQPIPAPGGPRGYCKDGGSPGMCNDGNICCPAFGCSDGSSCH